MSKLFSLGNRDDAAMHGEFMGFVIDDASLITTRDWAEKQGYPMATVQQSNVDMFTHMLEAAAPPKTALVDIDRQEDPVGAVAAALDMAGPECRMVVVGSANDVDLYRRMLKAGAIDYLVKPLTPEMLNQAMIAALRNQTVGKQEKKEAEVITFIGARGGVGSSTIALNIGWMMAHELNQNVALLDLDLQYGTSALALDIEPGRGLRDIASSPHRVDSLMIASSITQESEKFSVLSAEESVDEVVPMDGGAITALLKEMKNNFEVVIIDLPRHLLAAQKRLLTVAHEIVLVSDLSLAGIRDTLRIKSAITSLGCEARLTIVASRATSGEAGQVDRPTFEKGIQGKIDWILPEDAAAFAAASNSGKALGASSPTAAVTRILRELSRRLSKIEKTVAVAPTFWAKLKPVKKRKEKDAPRSEAS